MAAPLKLTIVLAAPDEWAAKRAMQRTSRAERAREDAGAGAQHRLKLLRADAVVGARRRAAADSRVARAVVGRPAECRGLAQEQERRWEDGVHLHVAHAAVEVGKLDDLARVDAVEVVRQAAEEYALGRIEARVPGGQAEGRRCAAIDREVAETTEVKCKPWQHSATDQAMPSRVTSTLCQWPSFRCVPLRVISCERTRRSFAPAAVMDGSAPSDMPRNTEPSYTSMVMKSTVVDGAGLPV